MTPAERYAHTAADELYDNGPPTSTDVARALADAWRAGWGARHAERCSTRPPYEITIGGNITEHDDGLIAWNAGRVQQRSGRFAQWAQRFIGRGAT